MFPLSILLTLFLITYSFSMKLSDSSNGDESLIVPESENPVYDSMAAEYESDYKQIGLIKTLVHESAKDGSQLLQDELEAESFLDKLAAKLQFIMKTYRMIRRIISVIWKIVSFVMPVVLAFMFIWCMISCCMSILSWSSCIDVEKARNTVMGAIAMMKIGVYAHSNGKLEEYEPLEEEIVLMEKIHKCLATALI